MERYKRLDAQAVTVEDLARGVEIRHPSGGMFRSHEVKDGDVLGRFYNPGSEVVAWFNGLRRAPAQKTIDEARAAGCEFYECGAETVGDMEGMEGG